MYAQENERGELGGGEGREGKGRRAREKETERWIGAPPNIVRLLAGAFVTPASQRVGAGRSWLRLASFGIN